MAPVVLEMNWVKNPSSEEFEGTIDVPHLEPQHQPDQPVPGPGIELPDPGILTVETETDHPIVVTQVRGQLRKLGDIELAVPIGEEEVFLLAGIDPTSNGCPVTLVFLMMNDTDPLILFHQSIRDLSGPVLAPVIDNDDFIILGHLGKDGSKPIHHPLHIGLFIIGREKSRKAC